MANVVKRNDDLFSIFDDFFKKDFMDWETPRGAALGTKLPAVNICETETGFNLEVAAPGLNKDDLTVSVDHGMLTISAEKKSGSEEVTDNYTRKEFNFTSFKRSFRLPEKEVDLEKIEAKYEDGILHVAVPKKDEVLQNKTKTILIS